MRYNLKLGVLLGVILGSALTVSVEAQGPFTAQIQRAINALTAGSIPFTGNVTINRPGVAATPTAGLTLNNATLATAAIPVQMPPCLYLNGNVWNTTAVAANNTDSWSVCSVPVSGATPSGLLKFGKSLNGGAATYPTTLSSTGILTTVAVVTTSGALTMGNGSSITFGTQGYIGSSNVNGKFYLDNTAANAGIGLDVTMAGVLLFKNTAHNAAGGIGFATLAVSGTAPTIASGFGTTPSIVASNGTAAFSVNVGTGGTASAGVLTMPASTTDWASCEVKNLTALVANRADQHTVVTASTTTALTVQNQTISTGAALAWTASDVLHFNCMGK